MHDVHATEATWLAEVLTRRIPMAAAMGLTVRSLDADGLVLALPLAPNINDKGSAFGGALSSALILAGWSLPRLLLRRAGIHAELVIGRCETHFLEPVRGKFEAVCPWPEAGPAADFIKTLGRKNKSALTMHPVIRANGAVAARLSARYAALKSATQDGENS